MEIMTDDKQVTPADSADKADASVPSTEQAGGQPAIKDVSTVTPETPPAFDPRTSYDGLQSEFKKQTEAYKALRTEFTRRSMREGELQKQISEMHEAIRKATEPTVNPEDFFRDLQKQGPKALDTYWKKHIDAVRSEYEGKIKADREERLKTDINTEIRFRRMDAANYPDFEKLEPIMKEMSEDPNSPINSNIPLPDYLDALYRLARNQNSEQAIQEAIKLGEKKADEKLAKEARSGVAGGGRSQGGTPVDTSRIKDVAKLRETLVSMFGVADRD